MNQNQKFDNSIVGNTKLKPQYIAISFVIFMLTGLFYAWGALSYPMVYDDLHLIRSFTREEIIHSFHGNWDPDHVETPGFRPLSLFSIICGTLPLEKM